jgi:hypothetical protein
LQESDHPIDVTHGEIRMFEPNSHRPLPIQPMVAEYTPAACHPMGCACERSFLRAVRDSSPFNFTLNSFRIFRVPVPTTAVTGFCLLREFADSSRSHGLPSHGDPRT